MGLLWGRSHSGLFSVCRAGGGVGVGARSAPPRAGQLGSPAPRLRPTRQHLQRLFSGHPLSFAEREEGEGKDGTALLRAALQTEVGVQARTTSRSNKTPGALERGRERERGKGGGRDREHEGP